MRTLIHICIEKLLTDLTTKKTAVHKITKREKTTDEDGVEKKICIALHSLSMVFIDFDFLLSLKCEQWQCQREKKVHSKKLLLLRHL